jgi:serine protease Do
MSVLMRNGLNLGTLVAAAFLGGLTFRGSKRSGTAASALSDAFASAALQVKPAVVLVQSEQVERADGQPLPPGAQDRSLRFGQRLQLKQGSGFLVSTDGYILTNSHLVATAARVTVRLYDRRELAAQVVGTDPSTDVAVLKIDARDLPTVRFGNSDATRVGDWALAIGNPLGETFAFTVTAGIISAKGRVLAGLQQSRSSVQDYLQTDAATNPGNSGGPLVDTRGQVVGINSAIASGTGFYIGYGLAIPINLARPVMDQLMRTGRVARTAPGLSIQELEGASGEMDRAVATASATVRADTTRSSQHALWYGGTLAPVTVFARAPRRQDSTAVALKRNSSRHAVN